MKIIRRGKYLRPDLDPASAPDPHAQRDPATTIPATDPDAALEGRILRAVGSKSLRSFRAIAAEVTGRRQVVFAALRVMRADGRLRFDGDAFRPGATVVPESDTAPRTEAVDGNALIFPAELGVVYVTFRRVAAGATRSEFCPVELQAAAIRSWAEVERRWGGGTYKAIGKDAQHRVIVQRPGPGHWLSIPGPSRPFASPGSTPASSSADGFKKPRPVLREPRLTGATPDAIASWATRCETSTLREASCLPADSLERSYLLGQSSAYQAVARRLAAIPAGRSLVGERDTVTMSFERYEQLRAAERSEEVGMTRLANDLAHAIAEGDVRRARDAHMAIGHRLQTPHGQPSGVVDLARERERRPLPRRRWR